MKHFTCKTELQLHWHYDSTHVWENNEGTQKGEGSVLVFNRKGRTYNLTNLRNRYGRNSFVRALRKRRSAGSRRNSWRSGLDIDDAFFRRAVRRQPRWEAEGLRPLRQTAHHRDYSPFIHNTRSLNSLLRSDAYALRGGRRTNAGRVNFVP